MALSLSSDIIDYLLTSLPDFPTLLSTILVSKSFHEAFQAHPSSILTSVATNLISPELLPCAVRLAHFNGDEYLASRTDYVQTFPPEKKFSRNEAPAVHPHILALIKNDSVVAELELFFSITFKGTTTGTRSLLNPRESLRFRRALYRMWLLNSLFPPFYLRPTRTGENADNGGGEGDGDGDDEESDTEDDDDDSDMEDDDDDSDTEDDEDGDDAADAYHAKAQGLRKVFLSEFSDDEVAEMWQVFNFMGFASSCARNATQNSLVYSSSQLWNSPPAIAEVFRALRLFNEPRLPGFQHSWNHNHPDNNWPGFSGYLEDKNYDTSKVGTMGTNIRESVPGENVILDDKAEDTEECDECHVPHLSPNLWSSSNWHLLPCAITFLEMLAGLPGHLSSNGHETLPLRAASWSFISFVNRHISPATPDWSEGKHLCMACVMKLMGRHVLNSLREIKAQHAPHLEDCWYGYKCRTQRRYHHAIKLNHLCDPTRGE